MPVPVLTLGSFTFENLEIPERIAFQSKQRILVHHLTTGSTVLDAVGTDVQRLSFRGIFTGPDTANRIQSIEFIRASGQRVSLRWDRLRADVLVHEFNLSYQSPRWVPYQLTCQVIPPDVVPGLGELDPIAVAPGAWASEVIGLAATLDIPTPPGLSGILTRLATAGQRELSLSEITLATEVARAASTATLNTAAAIGPNISPLEPYPERRFLATLETCNREAGLIAFASRVNYLLIQYSDAVLNK